MFRRNHTWTCKADSCISRFTIALLGAVLFGMGAGQQVGAHVAELCSLTGVLSVACYLSLEAAAHSRHRQQAIALRCFAEDRLSGQKQWYRLMRFCRVAPHARRVAPMLTAG